MNLDQMISYSFYRLSFVSLGSRNGRKQEMRIKEWMSQSYQTQIPDHYFNPISQQKRMNSRNNNFATQEEKLYKTFLPKHSYI